MAARALLPRVELAALEDLLATFLFRFLLFLALLAIRVGYSLMDAPFRLQVGYLRVAPWIGRQSAGNKPAVQFWVPETVGPVIARRIISGRKARPQKLKARWCTIPV